MEQNEIMEQRDDAELCACSGDFEAIYLLILLSTILIVAYIITH